MFYCVDRFEGDLVVLIGDDQSQIVKEKMKFDYSIKENDILYLNRETGELSYDEEETNRRLNNIASRLDALFNRKKR